MRRQVFNKRIADASTNPAKKRRDEANEQECLSEAEVKSLSESVRREMKQEMKQEMEREKEKEEVGDERDRSRHEEYIYNVK